MFDSVTIGRWGSLLLAAAILTIGNTILKPILAILTLPLIIVTFGLAYFAINVLMLALAEWLTPDFSIDGFWTYVGATIVVWLVNVVVGWLLDQDRGDVDTYELVLVPALRARRHGRHLGRRRADDAVLRDPRLDVGRPCAHGHARARTSSGSRTGSSSPRRCSPS